MPSPVTATLLRANRLPSNEDTMILSGVGFGGVLRSNHPLDHCSGNNHCTDQIQSGHILQGDQQSLTTVPGAARS
ncbi:MAG: hypothetical protein OXD33_05695 [Rhodobacteraceae bacterium]|nr:hypothetical protein [Paracoccaceae bacterium]